MQHRIKALLTITVIAGLLVGCGGGNGLMMTPERPEDIPDFSPVVGATDEFGSVTPNALGRAARATPLGASQSSAVNEDGRTADEVSVAVEYSEGQVVYEVTDSARWVVRVPELPHEGFDIALFTTLIPGIEPDLTTYPHDVFGMWAWEGDVGVFWTRSPLIPEITFGPDSPTGIATYEGHAAGLHAQGAAVMKFKAEVTLQADFDDATVSGAVDTFRSLDGKPLGALSVELGETAFSRDGVPFTGQTSAADLDGSGQWGARWSDGMGYTMGGTFGFAASDDSLAVLGAFEACACAEAASGDSPDDAVSTEN